MSTASQQRTSGGPKRAPAKAAAAVLLAAGAVVFFVCAFRTDLAQVSYTVSSAKVTRPVRLALVTDLHSCDYGRGQETLLAALAQLRPDAVLLGGDIVDDELPREPALAFLSAAAARYPCFYVSGNHEYRSGDIEGILQQVRACGATVLAGETAALTLNGQAVFISGVDDPAGGTAQFDAQLARVSQHAGQGLSVLLTHRPEYAERYRSYGFDVVLAGHAHGGQWRIPGLLNGLLAPNQGLFPRYAGGSYEMGDTTMVVSRGLARESTRIPRIFNRPELVLVEIVPQGA